MSPLLGRADALRALEARFSEGRRLVALIGPPGAGKSRLALALAAELSPKRYPGGIWRCDLEGCHSVEDIRARTLAALLGEQGERSASEHPVEEVLGRYGPTFLLLDDVETAFAALAPLLETWVRSIPGLTCLVTSRERVGLENEASFALGPLSDDAAVALFLERCEAARGAPVTRDPILLRAIVRRLDRMPLALELAAEHVRALEPSELLARLEPSLPFLSSSARTGARRTRCLRAALDGSIRALPSVERRALLALSQFRGEFDVTDAEASFEDPSAPTAVVLTRLCERSLLSVEYASGGARYRMLRVTREYAAELLASAPDGDLLRARFVDVSLRRVRRCLDRETDVAVLAWLSRHAESLLAGAQLCLDGSAVEHALELLVAASHAAAFQGPVEPALSLLEGIALEAAPGALRCRALYARGRLRARNGQPASALRDLEAAHAALTGAGVSPELRVAVAVELGNHHRHQGKWERAAAHYDEALEACAATRHGGHRAIVLAAVAAAAHEQGDFLRSRDVFEAALAIAREHALPLVEATILQNLGILLQELGMRPEAAACFRRAIDAHRRLGHRRFEGIAEYDLASLALEEDAPAEAAAGFARALELASDVGDRREFGLSLALLGVCHALTQELERATSELCAAERVLRALGQPALLLALDIHRAHLELAASLRDLETGDVRARDEKLASVLATLVRARAATGATGADATSLEVSGDEARYALRILESAHARQLALGEYALVDAEGRWFQPAGGQRVDISHRVPLQRLLSALVRKRMHAPNQPVPVDELLRAGWPAEKAVTKAGKNRLHVAVTTLRKSGLDPHLVHGPGGYHLARTMPWLTRRG